MTYLRDVGFNLPAPSSINRGVDMTNLFIPGSSIAIRVAKSVVNSHKDAEI